MIIPIDKIIPNPQQPRRDLDPDGLAALAASIKADGLINPIAVEDAGDHYILIDGERRWRAAILAGMVEIEASVRPATNGTGNFERLKLALVANLQRKDMNPMEEAHAYEELVRMGYTVNQIGDLVGLHNSNVRVRLALLSLDPEIQDLYAAQQLPLAYQVIEALIRLPDESRVRLARSFAQKRVSSKMIVQCCKRLENRAIKTYKRTRPALAPGEHWDAIAQLGRPVADHRLAAAAIMTCKSCVLYEDASSRTCQDCPAVDLLRRVA